MRVLPLDGPPTTADQGIAIPMRRIGQLYVVPVELNGSRMTQLILDTGASHTILSQEVVRELTLLPSDFRPDLVLLKTASGSVNAQVVRIDSMKIATAEMLNSSAAVHTMPDFPAGVDGLARPQLSASIRGHTGFGQGGITPEAGAAMKKMCSCAGHAWLGTVVSFSLFW